MAATLPDAQNLECLGNAFYILHDVKVLDINPQDRYRVVIAGPGAGRTRLNLTSSAVSFFETLC